MFLQLHNKKKKNKTRPVSPVENIGEGGGGLGLDEAKKAAGKRSDS